VLPLQVIVAAVAVLGLPANAQGTSAACDPACRTGGTQSVQELCSPAASEIVGIGGSSWLVAQYTASASAAQNSSDMVYVELW